MAQVVYSLSSQQQDVLDGVVDRLRAWREESSQSKLVPADGFHARPRPECNRVILLDGGRGTGKTSLLLTLVEAWYGGENAALDPDTQRFVAKIGVELQKHRFLPTVDFDPLPDGMPVYVWLLSAFVAVCKRFDEPAGWSAEDRTPRVSLRAQLQDLQQTAILGWGDDRLDGPAEDRLVTRYQGMLNWNRFRTDWRAFANALVARLESEDILSRGGLLVVPVDDLDMRLCSVRETLLALRQLNHPRVVFLVCGDAEQMKPALTYDIVQRVAGRGVFPAPGLLEEWSSNRRAGQRARLPGDPRRLAEEILEKQIPRDVRFGLSLMSLLEASRREVWTPSGVHSLESLLYPPVPVPPGPTPAEDRGLTRSGVQAGAPMEISYRTLTDVIRRLASLQPKGESPRHRQVLHWRRLGEMVSLLRDPRSPWELVLLRPEESWGPPWGIRKNVEIVETAPGLADSIPVIGGLRRSLSRRFVYAADPGLEVDELGLRIASQGTGPLAGVERLDSPPSRSDFMNEWSYRFFGMYREKAIPWLNHPGAREADDLMASLDGAPATGFEALRVWFGAPATADASSESEDLWTIMRRVSRVDSDWAGPAELTNAAVDSLGLLMFPECGLGRNERAFVLAFLLRFSSLERHTIRLREKRLQRLGRAGLQDDRTGGLVVHALRRAVEGLGAGDGNSMFPISWDGTNGSRRLMDLFAREQAGLPGRATFFSRSMSMLLGWVPMVAALEGNAGQGGLPHRHHGSAAKAKDQLAWLWNDWLLDAPKIWGDWFFEHASSEVTRMERVAETMPPVRFDAGVPGLSDVKLVAHAEIVPCATVEGVAFAKLDRWDCPTSADVRDVAEGYYDALIAGLGVLFTFAADMGGSRVVVDAGSVLLTLEGYEVPMPALPTWADYDLLFAMLHTLDDMAATTGAHLRRDWFIIALVDVVVGLHQRHKIFDHGVPRVPIPLDAKVAQTAGNRLATELWSLEQDDIVQWVYEVAGVAKPILAPEICTMWLGSILDRRIREHYKDAAEARDLIISEETREALRGWEASHRFIGHHAADKLPPKDVAAVVDWVADRVLDTKAEEDDGDR